MKDYSQLENIKTRALSIASEIQDYIDNTASHSFGDTDIDDLLSDVEGDLNALQIHLEQCYSD